MENLEILFWLLLGLVVYTYLGYGLILYMMTLVKGFLNKKAKKEIYSLLPTLTLVIPAYNEIDYLEDKVLNSLNLLYPRNKFNLIFVTDGSTDGSDLMLKSYGAIRVFHSSIRAGKVAAINRVMPFVDSEVVVFSDANAILNQTALINLAKHFNDPKIGCMAGEKRILQQDKNKASSAGEGLYWKYESALKKWSAQLFSTVGAAGELFAIRTNLYEAPAHDVILDDFMISLSVISKGYRIGYEPAAFALERGSSEIKEEMKRKVRICAGGLQAIFRTFSLLNPLKYPVFSVQYFSHRVLRWTFTPLALLLLIPLNIYLGVYGSAIYGILLSLHVSFYFAGLFGWALKHKEIRSSIFFIPFYFLMMNLSALLGAKRYFRDGQSVLWEKTVRL
jgi:cellulose synthase/poly-beta-1,6-N-acetylglucosamine synthase-like glycosyltransferase